MYSGVVRFSSRVDISEPNPIAQAEAVARRNGIALGKLNDSNPTRHGLAPVQVPGTYAADPRGDRTAREALAAFLTRRSSDGPRETDTRHADNAGVRSDIADAADDTTHRNDVAGLGIRPVDPDHLYLLSSTSQAYSWLIKLLCDAGDAVLAPKPGYPLIESIARLECVDTIEYQLQYDGSWFIDTAELEALLDGADDGRIRALVLINPNNPTGSYVKPAEREAIVAMCRVHDVALIADVPGFNIGAIQSAGGLLGFVLGSPLAWGLSEAFAIAVFVIVGLFSLLLITRTHVTDVPQRVGSVMDRVRGNQQADERPQFPNEVRVGDGTLSFAEGVPSHDGDDDGTDGSRSVRKGWLSRLFSKASGKRTDRTLERYEGDDPFDHAASRHGDAAETRVLGAPASDGARRVSSAGWAAY